MKNKNKKLFTVNAVDKEGIRRCYGTAEYPEDAKLQCIIAVAERCLRKLENGVRFIDGGDTDFYSYKFNNHYRKDAQKENMEKEIIKELREILKVYHYESDTEHMSKDVATSLENLLGSLLK